jgi:putative transposase
MDVMPSMGSVGDEFDDTMAESFFATIEKELLDRRRFKTQVEAKLAVFDWLEGWYNADRRHSSLVTRHSSLVARPNLTVNFERRYPPTKAA